MLSVAFFIIMLSVAFFYYHAECPFAYCQYAECSGVVSMSLFAKEIYSHFKKNYKFQKCTSFSKYSQG
jgi:hypothetical protein